MFNSSTMELRKAGETLLRSSSSTLLTPSASAGLLARKQLTSSTLSSRPSQRSFSSTVRACDADSTNSKSPSQPQTYGSKPSSPSWASALSGNKSRSSSILPSRVQDSGSAQKPKNDDAFLNSLNKGNSAADLLSAFNSIRQGRSPPSAFDAMKSSSSSQGSFGQDLMKEVGSSLKLPTTPKIQMRLNASTGRSVGLGAGIDVGRAFRLLEQSVARNKVRSDFTSQRYHERPGLKRKRLRRVRWRKRFMEGFRATVSRVKELKKQGW